MRGIMAAEPPGRCARRRSRRASGHAEARLSALARWVTKGSRFAPATVTAETIRAGKIVALKGIGGFQLIGDARREEPVARLRGRKRREEKPFAVMYPSLEMVRQDCSVSALEERLLLSPESPIVLLAPQTRRNTACGRGGGGGRHARDGGTQKLWIAARRTKFLSTLPASVLCGRGWNLKPKLPATPPR